MHLRRLVFCTLPLASSAIAHAQLCCPTPEAAAHSIVGSAKLDGTGPGVGFRVWDMQMDAVTRRIWVRVARCEAPGSPLFLVPLQATVAGSESAFPARESAAASASFTVRAEEGYANRPAQTAWPLQRILAVHAGEAVLVTFASSAVQMEVEGTAEQSAAIGDTIGVVLRRRGDEPLHRMRGILRADHRVEVQR